MTFTVAISGSPTPGGRLQPIQTIAPYLPTVMLLAMAIRAKRDSILNRIFSIVRQLLNVVNFKIWCSILTPQKGSFLFATFTFAFGPHRDFRYHIRVSGKPKIMIGTRGGVLGAF